MQYLKMQNLRQDMTLAKAIVGDNGSVLLGCGKVISETILSRMQKMGFQGAYIENSMFEDVVVQDLIDDDIRHRAFDALKEGDVPMAAQIAKEVVQQVRYKDTLCLDLLDIKNDKNYVYKHSISVMLFAIVVGIGMGMTEAQLNDLAVAGILHDIGKLEIKRSVLNSRSIYIKKDMDEMKRHPVLGYELLQEYPSVSSVSRNAVLFHHENLDGSGYYGLEADKQGIYSRILRVVDTYDALTARKKYREASSPAEAIDYIMGNVGTMFDKDVVEVFLKYFPIYPPAFTLRLSNGESCVVVSNAGSAMRPIVRIFDGRTVDLGLEPAYRTVMIEGML